MIKHWQIILRLKVQFTYVILKVFYMQRIKCHDLFRVEALYNDIDYRMDYRYVHHFFYLKVIWKIYKYLKSKFYSATN